MRFLILAACLLVGCTVVSIDDTKPDNVSPQAVAGRAVDVYRGLLAETFQEAAGKLERGEFASVTEYGKFITEQNRKANDVCFEDLRELFVQDAIIEDEQLKNEATTAELIRLSREIAEGLK